MLGPILLTPSEEVTRTWIKKKGILIKTRPKPSRFSFVVCLAIVFSIAFGFLGGFLTAGFALNDNYSSVYENLLLELENTRRCIEREKEGLKSAQYFLPNAAHINHINSQKDEKNQRDVQLEQSIFSTLGYAVDMLQKNDKKVGCATLNNIINLNEYSGKWKIKAQYLLDKNCL